MLDKFEAWITSVDGNMRLTCFGQIQRGKFLNIFQEVNDFDGLDGAVTIPITPIRKKHLKQQGFDAQIGDSISVRVIKFSLTTGEVETLITNLNPNEADYTACQKLYAKRWGIEVLYDDLKNKIELENFTGDSVTAIQQDFLSTAFFANFAALFQSEAAILISSDAENSEKNTVTNQTETSSSAKYSVNLRGYLLATTLGTYMN